MDEKNQDYQVEGFTFQDEELYEQAKREAEGVRYIRKKTNMDNPKMVFEVYKRIIAQDLFETPIGISYLQELQEYLLAMPSIPRDEIPPIPVKKLVRHAYIPVRGQKAEEKQKASVRFRISIAANIVLTVLVLAMFALAWTSKLPTIVNYETKLLDKYSTWEQDLKERERELMIKEREVQGWTD